MSRFEQEFARLNKAQRQAVETIEGPMLVVAGPGTGKTQLLSMRVANIIRRTDTDPSNILCLTFTDNAARNMRERLETIIGQAAYHVAIHTFHSFGVEIINQFPDYFTSRQLLQQIDEIGSYELLRSIFEELPHSNLLSPKAGDEFVMLKDCLSVIGWLKQNGLTPSELQAMISANKSFMDKLAEPLSNAFAKTPSPKYLEVYHKLTGKIKASTSGKKYFGFGEYAANCAAELERAIGQTSPDSRYAPAITSWRNQWCQKNASGEHVFKDAGRNLRKMQAVTNVYEKLLERMSNQGLYDFDDMIVETVQALESNLELRANIQERYQYVLVDEFQDTNKAQLRMLEQLGNNPLFEQRPNIMAVGDDDQAIYAFQGAQASSMVSFTKMYRQPTLITLGDNYRSSAPILNASLGIAAQISDRLSELIPDAHKRLIATSKSRAGLIAHNVLPSELAQYDWVAQQIEQYIAKGTKPEQIAVLAPRHRYLERLVPYLGAREIPIAYERRENILEAPLIVQLLTMARLVVAMADNHQHEVDVLIGEVLGYDFWELKPEDLLQVSMDCYNKHAHWLPTLAAHKNKSFSNITGWLMQLAKRSSTEPLEYVMDQLMGSMIGDSGEYDEEPPAKSRQKFVSPMRDYYFGTQRYEQQTDSYLTLLGQLSSLRQRLRQWKPNQALYIRDLVDFAQLHNQAHLKIVDTNPHTQTTKAVQVMTCYKAKGLEFDIVFLINAQDEVWGPTARSRSLRLTLPKNLHIAPASDGDNDKLRLLFVAMTRAKHTLHVTSYTHNLDNKLSPGLSFINDNSLGLQPRVLDKPVTTKAVEILATDWSYRFRQIIADKPSLLEPILAKYKLSVTHLNNFTNVVDAGPQYFLVHNLLRFPAAVTPAAAYGDAIHKTLQWTYGQLREHGALPTQPKTLAFFMDILARKHLRIVDYRKFERRGHQALTGYIKQRQQQFSAQDLIERGFNNEGVVIDGAVLSGKIDKMRFAESGRVQVVDFKTGKPSTSWQGKDAYEKIKLHKYRQQLLFYKLLVEHSASFGKKVKVTDGALEFIEPNDEAELVENLGINYDDALELQRFTRLITSVWQHIMVLEFPDISKYPKNLAGIIQFEDDLLDANI